MTPQEIQIAVAEEMGWHVEVDDDQFWRATDSKGNRNSSLWCSEDAAVRDFPPYTASIDAIREACMERFKTESESNQFAACLWSKVTDNAKSNIWQLTALDWCEAFTATVKQLGTGPAIR